MKKPRFFYGWVIVALGFITLAVRFGAANSFGVFFAAMLRDFGWSRGSLGGVQTVNMAMTGLSTPLVGFALPRFGARKMVSITALLLGISLAAGSQIETIWHFYLVWGVAVGLTMGILGLAPWGAIIPNWFDRKRGTALGVASAGIGLGYLVLVPLVQYIIERFSWQMAFIALGLIVALFTAPLNAWLLRNRPEEMGLLLDNGESPRRQSPTPSPQAQGKGREWTTTQALSSRQFWCLLVAFGTGVLGFGFVIAHQIALMVDAGYSAILAAFIFGLMGITGSVSKIVWGYVADHIGREWAYTMGTIVLLCGMLALMIVRDTSAPWLVYAYALLFGFGYGAFSPIIPAASADIFLGKDFAMIFSLINMGGLFIGALGPWMGGFAFDLTGNYNAAFLIALASVSLSCALVWVAAPRKTKPMGVKVAP